MHERNSSLHTTVLVSRNITSIWSEISPLEYFDPIHNMINELVPWLNGSLQTRKAYTFKALINFNYYHGLLLSGNFFRNVKTFVFTFALE